MTPAQIDLIVKMTHTVLHKMLSEIIETFKDLDQSELVEMLEILEIGIAKEVSALRANIDEDRFVLGEV